MTKWARALKDRRIGFGMSQQDLVEASKRGLNQAKVSRMEQGVVHPVEDLSLGEFFSLLKGLEWTLEAFQQATGLSLPFTSEAQAGALEAASRLEVRPQWLEFPVYGAVSAGKKDTEPLENETIPIPREKLRTKGAKPEDIKVYLVNGDCMISNEAQRIQKNIAPGDYVAVDSERKPQAGDVVVAWWPKEEKMVVKRYKIEGKDIVLYPVNPAHPNLVLGREEDVYIIGTVVWRGG